jgi:hypothetical protein
MVAAAEAAQAQLGKMPPVTEATAAQELRHLFLAHL